MRETGDPTQPPKANMHIGTSTDLSAHKRHQGDDVEALADIPAAVWSTATAAGMFTGLFWMLATGRLYTGASHREIVADKDRRIDLQDKTIESLTATNQKLTVNSDLTVQLLRSIDKTAVENGGDD